MEIGFISSPSLCQLASPALTAAWTTHAGTANPLGNHTRQVWDPARSPGAEELRLGFGADTRGFNPWLHGGSPGAAPVANQSFPSASGKQGHQDSLGLGCRLRETMYSAVLGIQVCAGQKSKLGRTGGWGGPLHSWGLCPGHRASRAVDTELGRCHQECPPAWRLLPGRSELGTALTAPCPRTFS